MRRNEIILLIVIYIFINLTNAAVLIQRNRRQTYYYPNDLRKYAQINPKTKFIHATAGRYAPQDWPAWLNFFYFYSLK